MKYIQNCNCIKSEPFINKDNNFKPYCRWCGKDFIKPISNYWMCSSNIN